MVGWIGELHPRLQRALDLDRNVIAFELDLAALQQRPLPRARPLSKFPSVRRDLAFIVPEAASWAAIADTVRAAAGTALRDLQLFDRYVGKGVESGCKSLAMGLILQEDSRTLTDRDAFIYPVLLGRRFLQTALIVDPARIHVTGAPEELLNASLD